MSFCFNKTFLIQMSDNKTLRNVKTEMDKRMAALDDSSIATVFVSYCKISKYASFLCDKKCGSNVISNGDIPAGIKLVRDLRKHIWVNPDSISMGDSELERKLKELSGRDHRNVLMLNDLFRMKQVGGQVRFTIGYDRIEVNQRLKRFYLIYVTSFLITITRYAKTSLENALDLGKNHLISSFALLKTLINQIGPSIHMINTLASRVFYGHSVAGRHCICRRREMI